MVNTLFDFVEMTCLYLLEDVFRKKLSKNEKKIVSSQKIIDDVLSATI